MNEELQGALTELINKSMNGVDAATGFLAAEIPDVVAQLLMWHGVYNLLSMIFGIFTTVVLLTAWFKKIMPILAEKEENATGDGNATYLLGSLAVCAVSFVIAYESINMTWLQIWIAPKVWLLEYAASLAK